MPQLNEALKNRKENSPANLLPSESSKLTFPVNRNLPSARSPAPGLHIAQQMITYYSIREDQNVSGGDRHLDHHTLRLADYHYATTIPSVVLTIDSSLSALMYILRKFNSNLIGYSTGIGSANVWEISKLNQAIPGAETGDLPSQSRALVQLMHNHPEINIKNDWKLVNIFIGANDMCSYCKTNGTGSVGPNTFKNNIVKAVQILKDHLPRTIVSLTGMFDMGMLRTVDHNKFFCDGLHVFECPCEADKGFTNKIISASCRKYMLVAVI
uniref:Lipase_GDSL domain-containing protein n=1 Tax=Heterorhabditis bacteriophora TaxID=37862 RepID=A0A1I7X3T0_HETBA